MTERIHTSLGTWILLFVSLFNLAALICLAVYQLQFQRDIEALSVSQENVCIRASHFFQRMDRRVDGLMDGRMNGRKDERLVIL